MFTAFSMMEPQFIPNQIAGLVGWWDMSSYSAGSWADKSGVGYNLTPQITEVLDGDGLGFAQSNTSARWYNSSATNYNYGTGDLPLTFITWAKPTTFSGNWQVLMNVRSGAPRWVFYKENSTNYFHFDPGVTEAPKVNINDYAGDWHMFSATLDASNNVTLAIDTTPVSSGSGWSPGGSSTYFAIGGNTLNESWSGSIGASMIYENELSTDDLTNIYNYYQSAGY